MESSEEHARPDGSEIAIAAATRPPTAFPPAEQRLLRLMAEFRRRQRERPDLVVRPWLSHGEEGAGEAAVGFVVEYCPGGVETAELRVRHDRATVEGPGGTRAAAMCLRDGWVFEGADVRGPELLANHLLRLAGTTLPGS
jgi:hypothetical protein